MQWSFMKLAGKYNTFRILFSVCISTAEKAEKSSFLPDVSNQVLLLVIVLLVIFNLIE
jgi:ABC-type multidrug transport system permease subunit